MQEPQIYVLNEKLFSIGGDLYVTDQQGNHVFEVDGKVLSTRRTLFLNDLQGRPLYEINSSLKHIHQTFEIKQKDQVVATIQKGLVSLFGERYTVTMQNGKQLAVKGNVLDHNFQITQDGRTVVEASRHWISTRDAHGIDVAPGFDVPFAIALAIALEQMELGHRDEPNEDPGFIFPGDV